MGNATEFLLIAPILLFSMVAHEYAHGYVAFRNGDPTAYQLGRLTWNPLKHIDPFMTVLLPLFLYLSHAPILGGAKPVPVNPRNFRNFKRGDIQVALAGVTTNMILAALCTALVPALYFLGKGLPRMTDGVAIVQQMMVRGISLNLILATFNLLPIPPLDGSHVFKYIFPPAWALAYERMGRYGLLILYLLLFFGWGILGYWFYPALLVQAGLKGLVFPYLLPFPHTA